MGCSSSFLPFQQYSEVIRYDSMRIVESRGSSSHSSQKLESARKVQSLNNMNRPSKTKLHSTQSLSSLTETESQHEETLQELREISKLLIMDYGNSLRGNEKKHRPHKQNRSNSICQEKSNTQLLPNKLKLFDSNDDVEDIMEIILE